MTHDHATDAPPRAPESRRVAWHLLAAVLDHGRPLDQVLETDESLAALAPRDRAFTRRLVTTVLRRLGTLDALVDHCVARAPTPQRRARAVRHLLRLGAAQLLLLDTPAHAAVHTTVAVAADHPLTRPVKNLINAVLRRLQREGAALLQDLDTARCDTPPWLWQAWTATYGDATTRALAAAHARQPPPLDVTPRDDPATVAALLEATVLPTGTLRRAGGETVTALPGYESGAWWVQDAAAALPARLLSPEAGAAVVDLCAAPGGKTAQLAATGAVVTAVERSAARNKRLAANLERLGLTATLVTADATTWRPPAPVRWVLLDAPCTATGTLRRHPDVAWLKTPEHLAALLPVQDALLDAAVAMLAPGGTLVYCVCSLQPEEGEARVAAALDRHPTLRRVPVTDAEQAALGTDPAWRTADGDLRPLPSSWPEGLDGFYMARLRREES